MFLLVETRVLWLFKVLAVCSLLAGVLLVVAEEKPPQPKTVEKPIDSARIKKLLVELGSEEFAKREEATADLIKMGAKIRPKIEEYEKTVKDPEVFLRLTSIRNRWEFPAVESLEDALRLHQRLLQKAVADNQSDEQVIRSFRCVEEVVEQAAGFLKNDPQKEAQLAGLRYRAAKAYLAEFKRNRNRSLFITQTRSEIKKCLELCEAHLKVHPNDKETQDHMREAQMIMYYSVKHAPLDLSR